MSSLSQNPDDCQPSDDLSFLSAESGLIIYRVIQQDSCVAPRRPILRAVNSTLQQVVFFRPLCKSWNCPYCAPRRATMWQIRAVTGVQVFRDLGRPVDFVTVTSHEKLSASASQAVLGSAWNKLRTRLSRDGGDDVEYFAVPEQHKNGRWHLHAIVTVQLKKRWWKDNARECGFGFQSDVQEVKSLGGVGSYVSKYLTKSLEIENAPRRFRRVRLSHGWPEQPKYEKPGWEFSKLPGDRPLNDAVRAYREARFTVVMSDGTAAWDWLENMAEV